jgi:hypothetical protein
MKVGPQKILKEHQIELPISKMQSKVTLLRKISKPLFGCSIENIFFIFKNIFKILKITYQICEKFIRLKK